MLGQYGGGVQVDGNHALYWTVTPCDCTVHNAPISRCRVIADPVHGAAVVPYDDVSDGPFMTIDKKVNSNSNYFIFKIF